MRAGCKHSPGVNLSKHDIEKGLRLARVRDAGDNHHDDDDVITVVIAGDIRNEPNPMCTWAKALIRAARMPARELRLPQMWNALHISARMPARELRR